MSKVLVNFIQDRSGSMASVWNETLSGFKKFVEDLRKGANEDKVEYLFSLTTFDTVVDRPIVAESIDKVDLNVLSGYGPRGATALYDAVGLTIRETEKDSKGADKIIVVIVTDGQENSSREWSKDALHQAVEDKLKAGNWTFTYLGTQPETWDDASALGVAVGAVASYTPTMARAAYACTSNAVHKLASSKRMSSRSLMHDYVPDDMATAAGMHVRRPSGGGAKPTPSPKSTPTKTAKRWR